MALHSARAPHPRSLVPHPPFDRCQPVRRRSEPGLRLARRPRRTCGSRISPVPPDVAYQLIHDELLLDGSARLNLATFVTTWMEPQARA